MQETTEYQNVHGNRKYKDTLFRMVFKKKEAQKMRTCFVATVRKYKKDNINLRKAITLAIDECIEKGIPLDILTKQRN